MKIFKFGGASVKDAESIKNVAAILKKEGFKNTLVVLSAMGKMTNAFEKIVNAYIQKTANLETEINTVKNYHTNIVRRLFDREKHPISTEIAHIFQQLHHFLSTNTIENHNFIYDQIVGYGEFLSTKIVSAYLNENDITTQWIDVRGYIKTDDSYRDACVDWVLTTKNIKTLQPNTLYLTQGFLGATTQGNTTTLGREGSDFTAAIFAYCLEATSLTIWKDVAGVLNADPRVFENTQLLQQISYHEAIEMAFYGASVIHPKTLKPLENKNIPLYVRSFTNLKQAGTTVSKGRFLTPKVPFFVLKKSLSHEFS